MYKNVTEICSITKNIRHTDFLELTCKNTSNTKHAAVKTHQES